MTRSDLIKTIVIRFPQLLAKDVELTVATILDGITSALASSRRVEIRGFGSFSLNYRPPRIGRNPKTGERVEVSAKYVPHFKAGKEMRERVDQSPVNALANPIQDRRPHQYPARCG